MSGQSPGVTPRPLVQLDRVVKTYGSALPRLLSWLGSDGDGPVRAVDGVSLAIRPGETVGLVGESGSGKSTLGRLLLRLEAVDSGRVYFDGEDITRWGRSQLLPVRRRMQAVFQDPKGSLNPRMRVADILAEGIALHGSAEERRQRATRVQELLEMVGLRGEQGERYPHQFSGGQRQRIGIARALSVRPDMIVVDEPTSALDVSVQGQIINLLLSLRASLGLSYLFISHDLDVVKHMSHRVAVMYLGKLVEVAPVNELFDRPRHPYTRSLIQSTPRRGGKLRVVQGDIPNPADPPRGCPFHPRCPESEPGLCDTKVPTETRPEVQVRVSCHMVNP